MKAKLYIPYVDYDSENGFVANIQMNEEEYVKYLTDGYMQSKFAIDSLMNGNHNFNQNNTHNKTYDNNNKYKYYEANISLLDINSQEENIDNLIKYFQTKEMFINQLYFDNIETLEDVEEDFKFWYKESKSINDSTKLNEDMKLLSLPTKEFKISMGNNSNAILKECKLLDRFSPKRYAILVKEIIFTQ